MTYNVNGAVIEGVADAGGGNERVVFTLTDNGDGTFTFDLIDQLDHSGIEDDDEILSLDLTVAFDAEDADNDEVTLANDSVVVEVENDLPTASTQVATIHVDEDELAIADGDLSDGITDGDGDVDEATFTNAALQMIVNSGADEEMTFSLDLTVAGAVVTTAGVAVTSNGDAVTYNVNGAVIEGVADAGGGNERVVFTLTDNGDGSFTFDLIDQLDHSGIEDDDEILSLDLTVAFMAEDADNDEVTLANDSVVVEVENDLPTASTQVATIHVDEDELAIADGDLSDGITDGDGDVDEATFTNAALQMIVNSGADEEMTFSLDLTVAGAVVTTAGVAVTSNGDAVTYNVNGAVIEGVADAGGGNERVVFTLTDNGDGSFTFDLIDQLDHSGIEDDDEILSLDLTVAFMAEDADNDEVTLANDSVVVEVENDLPVASGEVATIHVDEDELAIADGDLSDGITDGDGDVDEATFTNAALQLIVNSGADEEMTFSLDLTVAGAVVTTGGVAVTSNGDAVTYNVNGAVIEGVADAGGGNERVVFTLTDNGDGSFTFDLIDQLDHSGIEDDDEILSLDLTVAFMAEDADNDEVTLANDSVVVEVENDLPVASGEVATIHVDEDELAIADGDLSDGITDGDGDVDEATFTNAALQLIVNSGADEEMTFSLDLTVAGAVVTTGGVAVTSNGDAVTYNVNGAVIEGVADAGGGNERVVFTLTDNGDGSFTFDLLGPLDHSGADDDDENLLLDLTVAFDAEDADNDEVTLGDDSIVVEVENDIPTITDGAALVTIDETPGLQTSGVPGDPDEDNDDDDVDFAALPTPLTDRLTALLGPASTNTLGQAHSMTFTLAFLAGADGLFDVALTDEFGANLAGEDSGLDTHTNGNDVHDILLFTDAVDNNIVLGRDAVTNDIVFVIYIDEATNSIFVVQYAAIFNTAGMTADNADAILNAIHLTVTDNDGDSVTSPSNITVVFEDDGHEAFADLNTIGLSGEFEIVTSFEDQASLYTDAGQFTIDSSTAATDGTRSANLRTNSTVNQADFIDFFDDNAAMPTLGETVIGNFMLPDLLGGSDPVVLADISEGSAFETLPFTALEGDFLTFDWSFDTKEDNPNGDGGNNDFVFWALYEVDGTINAGTGQLDPGAIYTFLGSGLIIDVASLWAGDIDPSLTNDQYIFSDENADGVPDQAQGGIFSFWEFGLPYAPDGTVVWVNSTEAGQLANEDDKTIQDSSLKPLDADIDGDVDNDDFDILGDIDPDETHYLIPTDNGDGVDDGETIYVIRFGLVDYDTGTDGDADTNFNVDRVRIQQLVEFDVGGNVLDGTQFTDPFDPGTAVANPNGGDDRESVDGALVVLVSYDQNGDGVIDPLAMGADQELFDVTPTAMIDADFGDFTISENGDYLYEGDPATNDLLAVAFPGVTVYDEGFLYTVRDGDLDSDSAVLNIRIQQEGPSYDFSGDDVYLGSMFAGSFDAGAGADTLEGREGADTLTGGTGADIFVYGNGDGGATVDMADLITDFQDGIDLIGLVNGELTFADLTIDQSADVTGDATVDTVIQVTATSEYLAVLDGITGATTIDNADFVVV